jgi:Family of unknown function (DUF6200)
MATQPTSGEPREHRPADKSDKSQIVVVDFGKRQTRKQIKRLRRGEGKLLTRVEGIVNDLVTAGTVKSTAQPVVIVVREKESWPFGP